MYWDISVAASRERGESWGGGEGDSVCGRRVECVCVCGRRVECVCGGRRVESVCGGRRVECVCGDEGYSAVNMFLPGLRSWWNLLACCCY